MTHIYNLEYSNEVRIPGGLIDSDRPQDVPLVPQQTQGQKRSHRTHTHTEHL